MRINCLNFEIKQYYQTKKKINVRKGIRPGNSKSLWASVNLAKDIGSPEIPNNMTYGGVPVSGNKIADSFADFFDDKVKKLVESVQIEQNVFNGNQRPLMGDGDFMTRDWVYECMKQLKIESHWTGSMDH